MKILIASPLVSLTSALTSELLMGIPLGRHKELEKS